MERCPSVPQSNVPKLQARVVQMPSILSTRTNHEGDSLPRKRKEGEGLLVPWPVRTSVVRYFGPLYKGITRGKQDSEEASTGIL